MFLGVTGMLPGMPYTDEERRKLASAVRDARIKSRLDKEPASRAAAAFFLRADSWVRALAAILLVGAVFNAAYMEKQLSDKRNEIARMFNP